MVQKKKKVSKSTLKTLKVESRFRCKKKFRFEILKLQKNLFKYFRVSDLKCDIILRKSIL